MKHTLRLNRLFATHPMGVATSHAYSNQEFVKFSLGRDESRQGRPYAVPPPSGLLVAAILDALRSCNRYRSLVHVVPGEADVLCAQHVACTGGLVLTSDSDLLIHHLGEGKVAMMRDLPREITPSSVCPTFCPRSIARDIGLPDNNLVRLAYELQCSPSASIRQLRQSCHSHVSAVTAYTGFCQEYESPLVATLPALRRKKRLSLQTLDPRLSELVLQFGLPEAGAPVDEPGFFLPTLTQNPTRGNAWAASIGIRQVAYAVLRRTLSSHVSSVREFRTVQTTNQTGTQADVPTMESAELEALTILELRGKVRKDSCAMSIPRWTTLILILLVRREHSVHESSQMFKMIRDYKCTTAMEAHTSWDVCHLIAQIQAAFYSLHCLNQILNLQGENDADWPGLAKLRSFLGELPQLADYLDHVATREVFKEPYRSETIKQLQQLVNLGEDQPQQADREAGQREKRKRKRQDATPATRVQPRNNRFDILSED